MIYLQMSSDDGFTRIADKPEDLHPDNGAIYRVEKVAGGSE